MYSNINQVKAEAKLIAPRASANTLYDTLGFSIQNPNPNPSAQNIQHKKLFIRNIDEEVSDSLMENLLSVFGDINYWKRSKNEKGVPVSFGTVEFKDIESVLSCMRLFQCYLLNTKRIEVNMGDTTKNTLADYVSYKRREVEKDNPKSLPEEIDEKLLRSFSNNDNIMKDRLKMSVEMFFGHRDKIMVTDKGGAEAYTEEKLTSQKKKYGLINTREFDEMFKRDLEAWLKAEREYDDKIEKELRDEKDKHKRRQQLIDKELDFDEETEKDKIDKSTNYAKYVERRKIKRQKQYQDDLEAIGIRNKLVDVNVDMLNKRQSPKDHNLYYDTKIHTDDENKPHDIHRKNNDKQKPISKFTEVDLNEDNPKLPIPSISITINPNINSAPLIVNPKPQLFARNNDELNEDIDEETRQIIDSNKKLKPQLISEKIHDPQDNNRYLKDEQLIR